MLVRQGRFRRLSQGVEVDQDVAQGYLRRPGQEERFAHPAGGDVCTWIGLSPSLWSEVLGDAEPAGRQRATERGLYVDARLELAHRRLLAVGQAGGDDALEPVLRLVRHAVRQFAEPAEGGGGGSAVADRRLVAAARDAVLADDPAAGSLTALATLLRVSPFLLSRVFRREVGVSLTWFRNRARVGRAITRLAAGEPNLAALAADLGFADQAHLSRTMDRHLGQSPRAVRDQFALGLPGAGRHWAGGSGTASLT